MNDLIGRSLRAAVLCVLCLGVLASSASAAESLYRFDPQLSLTGDCTTSKLDAIPDPGCPDPPHPPSGRFNEPRSIAIDAYGNEYVASYASGGKEGRIDVFDHEGRFITELLNPHGPKSVAVDRQGNLYVFEQSPYGISRYTPTVYEPEAGNIEYGNPGVTIIEDEGLGGGGVAVDLSTDRVYAAHGVYLTEYGSAEEGNEPRNTIAAGEVYSSTWVAIDAQRRRLYASTCEEFNVLNCKLLVLEADPPYGLLAEVDGSSTPAGFFDSGKGWTSIAVDEESGHFFVEDLEASSYIYEFAENYEYVAQLTHPGLAGNNAMQIGFSNSPLKEDAANLKYLFVPIQLSNGRALAFEPPGVEEPKVLEVSAGSIGEAEAELRATIDPMGGDTSYAFEYVSQQEFEEEGFAGAQVGGQGSIPGSNVKTQVRTTISGLSPGTSYRFRVMAENESGKDEPIADGTFTTYLDAHTERNCPNGPFRLEASDLLPDCRAYELVTPPDTNGRPPRAIGSNGDQFASVAASPAGDAVSFVLIGGSLPGTDGAGGLDGDLYRSEREPGVWGTAALGPSGAESSVPHPGSTSPDQRFSFWTAGGEGSAVIDEQEGRYVRYPDGHSELVGRGSLGVDPRAGGKLITEHGTHIVFQTENLGTAVPQQLEPNAPPTGTKAIYDRTPDEVTHVVSLLPGDVTPAAGAHAEYLGASADGEGIAFEIEGALYLRRDNAVTYGIGTGVTFAGVSDHGERIFYVEGGDLLAFDTDSEEVIAFSDTGNVTPVNVAPQGTRAYFVSPSVLGGETPNGAVAQAGKENLYLSEEGQISFVGLLTERDVKGNVAAQSDGLGLWTDTLVDGEPSRDPSRLTPDGTVLLFQSRADLTGYDPGGSTQIYRYDSAANRLHCLSCIPTKMPADGGATLQSIASTTTEATPLGWSVFVPNLRGDGKRAFFQSTEALVSYDTDEVQDVYEWEEEGTGSCKRPGGCVYLISSGASERDNYLFGHSASGDDVFFTTGDVLTGFDAGGTPSIYDARVGGGFPEAPRDVCVGEGCHPAPTPPPAGTLPKPPARADDNVKPRRCPKGKRKVKRKGKVRCVKKSHKNRHRKGSVRRGASK